MQIIELLSLENKSRYVDNLKNCEWVAAKFLANLIEEDKLEEMCGPNPKVLMLLDGENIVSFSTYVFQDEIRDETLFPWVGFVYTFPKYRGNRCFGILLNHIVKLAKEDGYNKIFVSTNEVGLYEKYGFMYFCNMLDITGNDSRIYCKDI